MVRTSIRRFANSERTPAEFYGTTFIIAKIPKLIKIQEHLLFIIQDRVVMDMNY